MCIVGRPFFSNIRDIDSICNFLKLCDVGPHPYHSALGLKFVKRGKILYITNN